MSINKKTTFKSQTSNILLKERQLLILLLRKIKNQHSSTLIYKKAFHIKKLLNKFLKENYKKEDLLEQLRNFYVLLTSNFALNHFIPLTLVLIGIAGRLFKEIKNFQISKNKIKNNKNKRNKDFLTSLFK